MRALEPPDTHYLSAASGWLELGLPAEARQELADISAAGQAHPGVLQVRWSLCVAEGAWAEGREVGRALAAAEPENCDGWVYEAYALRRAPDGGLLQAWEALLKAAERFPRALLVCFNLACYASQLGRLDDARRWLKQASELGGPPLIKAMALKETDLEPLWAEIREW